MARKWIKRAVQRKGRVRRLLRLEKGQRVTASAIEKKRAQLRKAGKLDKSTSGALSLAKRFVGGEFHP